MTPTADELDPKRTVSQNRKMWPMLTDVARQKDWMHTNSRGEWVLGKMPPQAWKSVLTAAFEKETAMAQAINGGVVMVGASTSNYGIRRMADFIEFMYSTGSEWGIRWSEKSEEAHRLYGRQAIKGVAA
jgi:hypothetical protein